MTPGSYTRRNWTACGRKTESSGLTAMRDFQAKELNSETVRKSTLFYPFSGPDALMMNVFFPYNSTYVMVGLEPPGTLPTPAAV